MKMSERVSMLHHYGIDLHKSNEECLDELLLKYKELLDEKTEREKATFRDNLLNIKRLQN